ncbi:heterokaryon incompatibility protein-domain-containing protein [Immersiella caudata]|uniref:Heterokaryon incompatibility protein-domain-containing protein n=1 Tax=Immersiella caudata TaxID=314043 RepID=A0AA40BX25_9PEZI|nr:heterokaryon incompatibility protein-domain-containing protein [Immersiella caudata]
MDNKTGLLPVKALVSGMASMRITRKSMSLAKRRRKSNIRSSRATNCRLCAAMTRLAKKPLEYQQYRRPLGKVNELRKSECKAHTAILDRCQMIMRYCDEWTIKLEKANLQRTVQVGPNDTYGLRMALLPSSKNSTNPQYCGRRVHPRWINVDVVKNWRTICDQKHPECQNPSAKNHIRSLSERPALLIDTKLMCICEAGGEQNYLALSYVWGGSTQLKLSTANLPDLVQEKSLLEPHFKSKIPRTIRDAIGLVQVLGERYLWVDALCIIQDNEIHTRVQLQAMASIYGNAILTIVAAQGRSADHGLHGIPGVSKPRSFHQQLFGIANGRKFVHCPELWDSRCYWSRRGWTHQESLFSARKLMFVRNSVEWQCHYAIFREDLKEEDVIVPIADQFIHGFRQEPTQQRLLHPRLPNILALQSVIDHYLSRDFTYPVDIVPAFAGISSVLSKVFDGGFLFGIPEMFFDAALLWEGRRCNYKLREDRDVSTLTVPSWSWMGWIELQNFLWYPTFDHIKWNLEGYWSSIRTIPLVKWYSGTGPSPEARAIPNHWRKYSNVGSSELPPGWTAHEHKPIKAEGEFVVDNRHRQPQHFYKHESDPNLEFWYPLPLVAKNSPAQPSQPEPPSRFISCSTTRAYMTLGERLKPFTDFHTSIDVSVNDGNGTWAGCLHIPSPENVTLGPRVAEDDPLGSTCELAALSLGWAYNDSHEGLVEWEHPSRPREGEKYEWYNVMWIEWHGEAARRKGVGRISKEVWEAQELQQIQLVLN